MFKLVSDVLSTTDIDPSTFAPVAVPAINVLSIVTVSRSKFWITFTAVAEAPVKVIVAKSELPFPVPVAPIPIAPSTSAVIVTESKFPFPCRSMSSTLPARVIATIN